jgi:hypothetical protein
MTEEIIKSIRCKTETVIYFSASKTAALYVSVKNITYEFCEKCKEVIINYYIKNGKLEYELYGPKILLEKILKSYGGLEAVDKEVKKHLVNT